MFIIYFLFFQAAKVRLAGVACWQRGNESTGKQTAQHLFFFFRNYFSAHRSASRRPGSARPPAARLAFPAEQPTRLTPATPAPIRPGGGSRGLAGPEMPLFPAWVANPCNYPCSSLVRMFSGFLLGCIGFRGFWQSNSKGHFPVNSGEARRNP